MIALAVLAGGNSGRMGQEKALVKFLGQPLILHVLTRLKPLSEEVFVVTNRPDRFDFLHQPLYKDVKTGFGPLGGVFTALSVSKSPLVAIIACDMPFASLSLFQYELELIENTSADLVVPSTPLGLEPLHAIYRRDTCLPEIRSAMQAGERKLINWFPRVKTRVLSPLETEKLVPDYQAFINLNRPDEIRKTERLASRHHQP